MATLTRLVYISTLTALIGCTGQDVPLGGTDATVEGDAAIGAVDSSLVDATVPVDAGSAAWSTFTIFDTQMPRDIWGSGANDIWVVGRGGSLLRWTGGPTWNIVTSPNSSAELLSVWGSATDDVWAVGSLPGQLSAIFHYDGSNWTVDTSPADHELTGVYGLPSGRAWTVGHAFNFHSYSPPPTDDWTREQGFDIVYWPEDVWVDATANSDMWIVGNQGISRWSNADSAYVESFPAPTDLLGVWGLDAANVWAVGKSGTILRWNGTTWDAQTSNTTADLYAVWASSPNNAWAVGSGGTIVHWDGGSWQEVSSDTTTDLFGIWGAGATDIWAVGGVDSGIILRYAPQ